MTNSNQTKTAFAEWMKGEGGVGFVVEGRLRRAFEGGWKAAYLSLGLTPEHLRELERQYHEAAQNIGQPGSPKALRRAR